MDGWAWMFWALTLLGAGLVGYVAVRLTTGSGPIGATRSELADAAAVSSEVRAILEQRLARGELDAVEFRQRLDALEGR